MSGDVRCWPNRKTAKAYRKRCPTSLDFLRDMASVKDWHPDCTERFVEAADELERLQLEVADSKETLRQLTALKADALELLRYRELDVGGGVSHD